MARKKTRKRRKNPTMMDVVKIQEPDGGIVSDLVKMLKEDNPITNEELASVHRTSIRTGPATRGGKPEPEHNFDTILRARTPEVAAKIARRIWERQQKWLQKPFDPQMPEPTWRMFYQGVLPEKEKTAVA